jgi:hypothetical protein
MRRSALALACGLALSLAGGSAGAQNPWSLRCASMPLEQPVPGPLASAARAFSPWWPASVRGLSAGPVFLVAGSNRTQISRDGDPTDSSGNYLHRVLLAVSPAYAGAVTISGHRIGGTGPHTALGFSTNGATRCSVTRRDISCPLRPFSFASSLPVAAASGWRIVRTELRIGSRGCFELTASGPGLHETIPLAVPGPAF